MVKKEKKKREADVEDAPDGVPWLTAKKDFVIKQNEYFRKIKAGDNLSDIPDRFLENLRTEGVL